MRDVLVIAGLAIVVGWILFRAVTFLRGRLRRAAPPPDERYVCPKCGSKRLDDLSDRESGYCLQCQHVWGVDPPPAADR